MRYTENRTRIPNRRTEYNRPQYNPNQRMKVKTPRRKKLAFIPFLMCLIILSLYGYFICPYAYRHFVGPLFLYRILNKNIELDVSGYINPINKYINNSYLFDTPLLVGVSKTSKTLNPIVITQEMASTKNKLLKLFEGYQSLKPSVFVWDYSTGAGIEINADEVYPSASIIKIPIAIELLNKVNYSSKTPFPVNLQDERMYTDEFKTLGSGKLQYTLSNVNYSLDHLANIMIADSDNSATNMLLYEIGGIDGFNKAMRNYGLNVTSMGQWLPDMEGENVITAREISTLLYNIDNSNFVSPKYKNKLKEYLGNTKNVHLLKEKLPQDVMILHKTGNIGEMLGDSGIVYSNAGKKYIVTILVKRPKNDMRARTLIQDASLLIYNDINNFR